jgi:hypothetical protein
VVSEQWLVRLATSPLATSNCEGAVAQLGERLVCNQEATGSIPVSSTRKTSLVVCRWPTAKRCTLADLIELVKYFFEFVLVLVLILFLAYWPPKDRGIFGQRLDNDEPQTLFGNNRWWQ